MGWRGIWRGKVECCGDQTKESQRLSSGSEVRGRQRYIAMERKQGLLLLQFSCYTSCWAPNHLCVCPPPQPKLGFGDPGQNISSLIIDYGMKCSCA